MTTDSIPAAAGGVVEPPGPLRGARGTRAHTAAQLRDALGWSEGQFGRACAAGLIPDPDMQSPRWSGAVVEQLWARREELAAAIPADDLNETQLRGALGLEYGDWVRGRDAGLIPDPDRGGVYWTPAAVEELIARGAEIRASIPPQPLGASRCARLLADAAGLEVTDDDVRTLARRGLTSIVDYYKEWALYDVAALRTLVAGGTAAPELVEVVAERQGWLAASLTDVQAAELLDCRVRDVASVLAERGIAGGRFGRYPAEPVRAIADDEEAMEGIRRGWLLGPDQAAEHMEIRRTDLEYVLAAGWVAPATHAARKVGRSKTVDVPLYRVGDLEDALQIPGVDWEGVRAAKPGEPSPLREHTRLPATRARVIRAWCDQLSLDHGVEVWPRWWNAADVWEIDWEQDGDGHPTIEEVTASLRAHHGARRYADQVRLSTAVGDVIRWARRCLEPGTAVVCDTETCGLVDPVIVELAVVDAATGETLLDTLVNPAGAVIEPEARAVHGITDAELAEAPSWEQVAPRFAAAVAGREILAYNAPFDRSAAAASHRHAGLDSASLPPAGAWSCLMQARSTWMRVGYRIPLGGGHRALGDARDAREVLRQLAHAPGPEAQR